MTDRELLEAAAKAAGLRFAINGDGLPGYASTNGPDWRFGWSRWNPLLDDGDAFRLAVKLQIEFAFFSRHVSACAAPELGIPPIAEFGNDRAAATRRAIVRAAAAVWEQASTGADTEGRGQINMNPTAELGGKESKT